MNRLPEGGHGDATRVLVIGGSAGALGPLTRISEALPRGADLAVLVVLHRAISGGPSMLPNILNRHSVFRAVEPSDGDPLLPDYVYVAPPGHHLELQARRITLNCGPKVNGQRPAIDVLFESAARAYGAAVVGVILSGNLDDGSQGLLEVRRAGGQAIVLDPDDSAFPAMPRSAIERAAPVITASSEHLPTALGEALRKAAAAEPPVRLGAAGSESRPGPLGPLGAGDEEGSNIGVSCPECGGSLWLSGEPEAPILQCRIGHRMSPESLSVLHSESLERALWAALRSLEEEVAVARFMEDMSRRGRDDEAADRHRERGEVAARETETLRHFLLRRSHD